VALAPSLVTRFEYSDDRESATVQPGDFHPHRWHLSASLPGPSLNSLRCPMNWHAAFLDNVHVRASAAFNFGGAQRTMIRRLIRLHRNRGVLLDKSKPQTTLKAL
jgi:hypothetical protein